MARYYGTTAERGLGGDHVADRKRLLSLHRDGDLCWRCGQPMYKAQGLDRDHVTDRALGGTTGPAVLAHASCNRSAGARLGNRLRPFTLAIPLAPPATCKTCGRQVRGRAARTCEICGAHYHPNHSAQRTCSRACGVVLSKRNRMAKGWVPPNQRPKPPRKQRIAPVASGMREPKNGWPASRLQHYACRYCGTLCVAKATGQQREVCPARGCQLARLQANHLRVRNGLTKEEADAQMAALVMYGKPPAYEQWRPSREW